MPRDDDRTNRDTSSSRDRYRDNDDVRNPLEGDDRTGGNASTESEARGKARENVGNHSRGTDTDIRGADENDKTRQKPRADQYDTDLAKDNDRR
jgi:hypothetical protein